jgi:hypothetical protein
MSGVNKMKSRVHLCTKAPFSTNQDILNSFFADILAKFWKIYWCFQTLDDILQHLTKLSKFKGVSNHRQPAHLMPFHQQPNSSTVSMSLLGVNSLPARLSGATFGGSCSLSLLDPTVWLDGARPANTCIPPSFP